MNRGAADQFTGRRANRWTVLGSLVVATTLIACGGRTATDDNSLLDDSSLIGAGEILDVTNAVSTVPGTGVNLPNPVGTGVGSISQPPTPPRPVPPRPAPPTPTVPPTTAAPTWNPPSSTSEPWTTTDEPSTVVTEPTTSSPASSSTAPSTTATPTSEPKPTSTGETSEPPPPFDPLHPPDGQVPFGLGPEYADVKWLDTNECSESYAWAGSFQCYAYHSCDQGWTNIDCYEYEAGSWACHCNGFDQTSYYVTLPAGVVPADDSSQACRVGSAICLTDAPRTQEPECDDRESSSRYYCSRDRTCDERLNSAFGDFVISGQAANVNCSSDGNTPGVTNCSCGRSAGYTWFTLGSGLPDACETGIDVCVDGVAADSSEPVECSWASTDFASAWCQQYYECSQRGESNGVSVSVFGQVNVNCWMDEGEAWSCSCGDGTTVIGLSDELTSPGACEAAAPQCVQALGSLFD